MATFNFSTMQMTVKVVYYGPGLCGKTTNLQFIYNHTAPKSRGEMVSLETKTDRTLFFDLLPLEVGTIAGFKTKIQLYTVPGQVFYNTTRKLVLKGVDGIVFVADSQRPMLPSNIESLANLESNLAELGMVMDTVPLVFQYNKRDLRDICPTGELDGSLNSRHAPAIEASALTGMGVFETLRAISRETLGALKKQLEEGPAPRPGTQASRPATVLTSSPVPPRPVHTHPENPVSRASTAPKPETEGTLAARPQQVPPSTIAPAAAPNRIAVAGAATTMTKPAAGRTDARTLPPPTLTQSGPSPSTVTQRSDTIRKELLLRLERSELDQVRRVAVSLRLEDGERRLLRQLREVAVDVRNSPAGGEMTLQLNIRLNPEG